MQTHFGLQNTQEEGQAGGSEWFWTYAMDTFHVKFHPFKS